MLFHYNLQTSVELNLYFQALHENHAAQIKQLTDEIAALRQRLHETDGKHQV
jgi:phage host-nuclease inhibitor protein Gam